MIKLTQLLTSLAALGTTAMAADIAFSYNITGTEFLILGTSTNGPTPSVSGSFGGVFTPTAGLGTNVSSLSWVNLTIDGFSYTTTNTGLDVVGGTLLPNGNYAAFFTLGGLSNGLFSVGDVDDFIVQFGDFGGGTGTSDSFYYKSSPGPAGSYSGRLSFAATTSVPDSGSSCGLLVLSIFGLTCAWCRCSQPERSI